MGEVTIQHLRKGTVERDDVTAQPDFSCGYLVSTVANLQHLGFVLLIGFLVIKCGDLVTV